MATRGCGGVLGDFTESTEQPRLAWSAFRVSRVLARIDYLRMSPLEVSRLWSQKFHCLAAPNLKALIFIKMIFAWPTIIA